MKIAALLSACIFIGGGAVSFATNNSEADTQPKAIKEMKNAPNTSPRRTRTAGRSEDPNTGMAAPYSNTGDNSFWNAKENSKLNSKNNESDLDTGNTIDNFNFRNSDSMNNNVSGVTGATTETDKSEKADNLNQNSKDLEITREIRRGLVNQNDLSVRAHNLSVVTQNGLVTLRGTVPLTAEKVSAGQIAQGVSGVSSVNNLIQVSK